MSGDKQKTRFRTSVQKCEVCGRDYLLRGCVQEEIERSGRKISALCHQCRREKKAELEKERERAENEKRREQKERERQEFEKRLKAWPVLEPGQIEPQDDDVLYLLGNGFDLMHRVPSSYYDFRDYLGKNSVLRETLEQYLTDSDIWADFESSLAHINVAAMGGSYGLDALLDGLDAYDEDASAASFFGAIDDAAAPMWMIANELPVRFRKWVNTLAPGTADRPLRKMFRNGRALCFNYTEFAETLYGMRRENICYIHGCRKGKDGRSEPLILGHMRGASDAAFDFRETHRPWPRNSYNRELVDTAQQFALYRIAEYDADLTKDVDSILAAHQAFFDSLTGIRTVISVGHSFSPVDWAYYEEIKRRLRDANEVKWLFGCYGLRDLKNLEAMISALALDKENIAIFRTDLIRTAPLEPKIPKAATAAVETERRLCRSPDGRWDVSMASGRLRITDCLRGKDCFDLDMGVELSGAFFVSGRRVIAYHFGMDPGVYLLENGDAGWKLIGEFVCGEGHSLLNRRLKKVFLSDESMTFVYNNRVRAFSLETAEQIMNRAREKAPSQAYEGQEITALFPKR